MKCVPKDCNTSFCTSRLLLKQVIHSQRQPGADTDHSGGINNRNQILL